MSALDKLQTGFTPREIRIPAGSAVLEGELTVPPDPQGLILCVKGVSNSGHRSVAQDCHRAGLGTLLFNLLTPEEAGEGDTRGHLRFNIGLLKQRLTCAAHWVADEDEARNLRLGFLGFGAGGAAALVAAADLGKLVGAIVSWGGRPDLAGNALRRVKAPTLFIAGGEDDSVLEFNQDAYEMLDCPKKLEVIPNANQLMEEPGAFREATRLATDWFLENLRPFASARFARLAAY